MAVVMGSPMAARSISSAVRPVSSVSMRSSNQEKDQGKLKHALPPRAVVRRNLAQFQGAQIGRGAAEAIGHVVQNDAAVLGRGAGLELEVEIFRPVEPLNRFQIFVVKLGDVHEDGVIHADAVLVLMGGA